MGQIAEDRRQRTEERGQKTEGCLPLVICHLSFDFCPLYLLPGNFRRLAPGQAKVFGLGVAQHHRVMV